VEGDEGGEGERERGGGVKYSSEGQHSHIHGRHDLLSLEPCNTVRAVAKILLIYYARHALARYH